MTLPGCRWSGISLKNERKTVVSTNAAQTVSAIRPSSVPNQRMTTDSAQIRFVTYFFTRLPWVCEAAGLTERYFYESFTNSEALLVAAFDTVSHRVLASLREVCKAHTGTAEARGKAVLRAYYQILKDDPDGARLFVIEIARVGPAVDEVWAALLREFGELLTQAVARDRAAMRASNELVRTGAVGAMVQIAKVWIRSGYARSVDAVASDALRLCRVLAE